MIDFDLWLMDWVSFSLFTVNFRCITNWSYERSHLQFCTCSACGWRAWAPCRSMHLQNTAVDGWHQLKFICTYCSLSIRGENVSQNCHSVITTRLFKAYVTGSHQKVLSCARKFTDIIPYLSCSHYSLAQLDRLACYFWTFVTMEAWIKSIIKYNEC